MLLIGFIVWKPLDIFATFSKELKSATAQRLQPKCQIWFFSSLEVLFNILVPFS